MTKKAVKELRKMIGEPVRVHWVDAVTGVAQPGEPLELVREEAVGILTQVDEEKMSIYMGRPKPSDSDMLSSGDSCFVFPTGWVKRITLLVPGPSFDIASSFTVARVRAK